MPALMRAANTLFTTSSPSGDWARFLLRRLRSARSRDQRIGVFVSRFTLEDELRAAVLRLDDVVVLFARPHVDPKVRGFLAHVPIDHVPRLHQRQRIVNGDVIFDDVSAHFSDPLHRADLVAVVGLAAVVLAFFVADRVDDKRVAVPEADRVSRPRRVGLVLRHMTASVGVNAADFALLLVNPPNLFRSHYEFAKKWLGDPARKAGGEAKTQVIPLDALFLVGELLLELRLVLRCQLGTGGRVVRDLRIEPRSAFMRPDASPVG